MLWITLFGVYKVETLICAFSVDLKTLILMSVKVVENNNSWHIYQKDTSLRLFCYWAAKKNILVCQTNLWKGLEITLLFSDCSLHVTAVSLKFKSVKKNSQSVEGEPEVSPWVKSLANEGLS